MTWYWLVLFVVLLAGPTGWLAQNRRLRHTIARQQVHITNLTDRVEFEQAKSRQWAEAFPFEHDARRRGWRCRTHVYGEERTQ